MEEFFKALLATSIPNILVVAGVIFLGIAIVGKITGKIDPGRNGRIAGAVLGCVLLIMGLAINLYPFIRPTTSPTPTLTPPTPTLTLNSPLQISPANGTVFNNYPRTTMLQWSAVPGATTYTVEIDCYQCCATGKWCTDVGKTWKLVANLRETNYTFDFVGAQPGRWRVWAVNAAGLESPKTGWWEFSYTQ